jgi:RsiW-degrading membrane proteinase PrsW (M82 family)
VEHHRGHLDEAARRLAREAAHVPDHAADADLAVALLLELGDADAAAALLDDPAVSRAASAGTRFRLAVERRDLRGALRWTWGATFRRPDPAVLALTIASALAWLVLLARLGDLRSRPLVKLPLYAAAIALGVVSVAPTMFLLAFQESVLHLTESHDGNLGRDAIYFFFGVGFREELSKFLLFLPLYPLVRRTGSKLDVLICGALVGLGFAAEENLLYLSHGSLSTALARYMTANFAHIAWTSLAAGAFHEMFLAPEDRGFEFSRTLLVVMAMHGAYDFFLSAPGDGMSYLSMALFIVLGRMFLGAITEAHPRVARGIPILDVFAGSTAVVIGASYLFAAGQVGPQAAALVMFEGLLGVALYAYFFVQAFRRV